MLHMLSASVYRSAVAVSYFLPPISQGRAALHMLLSIVYRSAVSIPGPWFPISQERAAIRILFSNELRFVSPLVLTALKEYPPTNKIHPISRRGKGRKIFYLSAMFISC